MACISTYYLYRASPILGKPNIELTNRAEKSEICQSGIGNEYKIDGTAIHSTRCKHPTCYVFRHTWSGRLFCICKEHAPYFLSRPSVWKLVYCSM